MNIALWLPIDHFRFSSRFQQGLLGSGVHDALVLGVFDRETVDLGLDLAHESCLFCMEMSADLKRSMFLNLY